MELFRFDTLSLTMIILTIFVGFTVFAFSKKYIYGDIKYKSFMFKLATMIVSLVTAFASNNIILFAFAWLTSNVLLVNLMIHKRKWKEAYNSGMLSLTYLLIGFAALIASLTIFYHITGSLSLTNITSYKFGNTIQSTAAVILLSIFIAIQSGLLPFHKWLTSSLNSPTPISAIMHAGIVNGGGFIFIRFSSIYLQHQSIMNIMFIFGWAAVIIGTIWKLMQNDIKRMLACSTISQMGYMICQCSIGAFAPAMIHIIMHGVFKANLFLHSPSSWNENIVQVRKACFKQIMLAVMFGCTITAFFLYGFAHFKIQFNASLVLVSVIFIFASQFSMTIIQQHKSYIVTIPTMFIGCFVAMIYGKIISITEVAFVHDFYSTLQLQWMHIAFIVSLFIGWIFVATKPSTFGKIKLLRFLYINLLNLSQPHKKTVTKNRNSYNF